MNQSMISDLKKSHNSNKQFLDNRGSKLYYIDKLQCVSHLV